MLRKLLGLIIIIFLSVIVANAQSQQPTSGTRKDRKPPQKQSSSQQQKPEPDKRGTEQEPFVVKTIPTPKSEAETKQDREEREKKAANDRKLVWFTAGLVLVTAILAVVAVYQGIQMRRSVDSQCRSERAYLFVTVNRYPEPKEDEIIQGIKPGYNQARIIATNHGKTPAVIMKIVYEAGVFRDNDIDKLLSKMKAETTSKVPPEIVVIKSSGERGFTVDYNVSEQDERSVDYSIINFTCFGRIEYKDVFDMLHIVVFCWKDNGIYFSPDPQRYERT